MLLLRRFARSRRGALALAAAALVLYLNRQVLPLHKGSWVPRFGEPGPPTARDVPVPPLPHNLTLHMVPHSHSDIGWNLSFEGYYRRSVQNVLRRVVRELWADPRRRFTWGDLAFVDMWMDDEGDQPSGLGTLTWRQALSELIRHGQWDMVGGTYVSPDEGMTTWWAHTMVVDVGHRTLARHLNVTTRIGWQIDNFGHFGAAAHALTNAGYNSLVLGRMDFRDLYGFASHGDLQFLWQPPHAGSRPLLTHFLSEHYAQPSHNFDFDNTAECRVDELLAELLRLARRNVRQYPAHGHILVMMGDDLRYVRAARAFACLDRLIKASATNPQWHDVRLRYSTMSDYFDSVRPPLAQVDSRVDGGAATKHGLRLFTGDLYPYQDKPYEQYWSGILASRPHLKWLVREAEQAVQHAEALVAMLRMQPSANSSDDSWMALERRLEFSRKQVAIGYHHDAITGTCSQSAADDYARRLQTAARTALRVGYMALQGASAAQVDSDVDDAGPPAYNTATRGFAEVGAGQQGARVVVTNAHHLAAQNQVVHLHVDSADTVLVDEASGQPVRDLQIRRTPVGAFAVEFLARNIPPFGMRSYLVASRAEYPDAPLLQETPGPDEGPSRRRVAVLRKGTTRVRLVAEHGGRVRIEAGSHVVFHQLRQYFVNPFVQSSGAYIMHSFALMYGLVFWIFGGALCAGLAAAWFVHRCPVGSRILRVVRMPQIVAADVWNRSAALAAATAGGGAAGSLLVYYAAQIATVDRLNSWTRGDGLALLVLPAFASAYVVGGALRWGKAPAAMCAQGVALGVALSLLLARNWQSRELTADKLEFTTEHGSLCDRVRAHVSGGTTVEYVLCEDSPEQLQVATFAYAPADREIVARFADPHGRGSGLDIYDGMRMRHQHSSRWKPIPGTYYPAPSYVRVGDISVHARQPMGASCIGSGTLELMLHRNMTANDYRGMREPLIDREPALITHLLDLRPSATDTDVLDTNHRINAPPLVFILPSSAPAKSQDPSYSGIVGSWKSLHLVGIRTQKEVDGQGSRLRLDVRLMAHAAVDVPVVQLVGRVDHTVRVDGDWSLCDSSAAQRVSTPVDRVRLQAGEQALFQLYLSAN
ncbi:Alpha-mannosidase 2 [Coemansia sp. RSA 552]|nr:Alpha-mannosidase 2 [Coemansia sp. RSA 552]